jgi:hypothetical protein
LLEQQALARMQAQKLADAQVIPSPSLEGKTRWAELFSKNYLSRTILAWIRWFVGASILVGFASWLPTLYTFIGVGQFQVQLLNILFGMCTLIVLIV